MIGSKDRMPTIRELARGENLVTFKITSQVSRKLEE
jgi:hypothetical protein